jgi:hypothetical protein
MPPVKSSFALFVVLASATFGCGSSSSNNPPKANSGNPSDASTQTSSDAGGGGGNPLGNIMATCGLLAGIAGGSSSACGSGMTCCTIVGLPPSASCVAVGSCGSGDLSNECTTGTDCASGQLCCAGSADGGAPADAAAAGGGGFGGFDPTALSTTCQSSCTSSQAQTCTADMDCPTGLTCQSALGGGGGGLGGLGGLFGGISLPSVCRAPLPDAGSPPDSGTVPEASTPDAGDTVDAGQGDQ